MRASFLLPRMREGVKRVCTVVDAETENKFEARPAALLTLIAFVRSEAVRQHRSRAVEGRADAVGTDMHPGFYAVPTWRTHSRKAFFRCERSHAIIRPAFGSSSGEYRCEACWIFV
jgi:hypothetical protein